MSHRKENLLKASGVGHLIKKTLSPASPLQSSLLLLCRHADLLPAPQPFSPSSFGAFHSWTLCSDTLSQPLPMLYPPIPYLSFRTWLRQLPQQNVLPEHPCLPQRYSSLGAETAYFPVCSHHYTPSSGTCVQKAFVKTKNDKLFIYPQNQVVLQTLAR